MMIKRLKEELSYIEDAIFYLVQSDEAWSKTYTILCKQRRILKRMIRRLERLDKKR
jgi:hypothetical protein